MASSMEHGKDLPSVQLLMKKNQVRQGLKARRKGPESLPRLGSLSFLKNWHFSGSPLMLCAILDLSGSPFLFRA